MPTTEYVVCDFPTIMDGYVVRWYATEHDANHGEPIISASRNGVVKHTPGPAADTLEPLAMGIHDLIATWYGRGFPPMSKPKTWAHVLTHKASMFRDVEPIAKESR